MAEVTAITNAEQLMHGFAGTADKPHPQAYKGTLTGVSVNTNDPERLGSPKPYQTSGPGANIDDSEDFKKG